MNGAGTLVVGVIGFICFVVGIVLGDGKSTYSRIGVSLFIIGMALMFTVSLAVLPIEE